jgi:hypothetical protein
MPRNAALAAIHGTYRMNRASIALVIPGYKPGHKQHHHDEYNDGKRAISPPSTLARLSF